MAKKKRRREPQVPRSHVKRQEQAGAKAKEDSGNQTVSQGTGSFLAERYAHTRGDLKRITIFATAIFLVMIGMKLAGF